MDNTANEFIKEFRKIHKEELDDVETLQRLLKQIKAAESEKTKYFTQLKFNVR